MKILINSDNIGNNNILLDEYNKLKSEIITLYDNTKLQLKQLNNILNYLNNLNNPDNYDIKLVTNEKKKLSKKLKYIKSLLIN